MQNIIQKGQTNTLYFSLWERRLSGDTGQLFVFYTPTKENEITTVQNNNLSDNTRRYDKFKITESNNPNPTAATVNFPVVGEWRYKIYEQVSGSTNLDIDKTSGNVLESGFIHVEGTGTTTDQSFLTDEDNRNNNVQTLL